MSVEAATNISELDESLPTASDAKSEGDDHIRKIKYAIKLTFPSVTGVSTSATNNSDYKVATTSMVQAAILASSGITAVLPGQGGNSGKLLTTDGSAASWTAVKTIGGVSVLGSGDITTTDTTAFDNKIINGDFRVDQRNNGSSQTITAAAALAYTVDRWYAYCTGANVTGQQVAGSVANTYRYKFTGAASVTAVGFGTRLEAKETSYLAGSTATLQVKLASSSLTSIGWAAYYANTADTFGSLASPTRTSIASGTFTITSTEATYSTNITLPAGATTGIEIVFTGGALLATHTLTIGDVQFETGSVATTFKRRPLTVEQKLCWRYYYRIASPKLTAYSETTNSYGQANIQFPVLMRIAPTALAQTGTAANYSIFVAGASTACTSVPAFNAATVADAIIYWYATSGHTAGQAGVLTGGYLAWDVEL